MSNELKTFFDRTTAVYLNIIYLDSINEYCSTIEDKYGHEDILVNKTSSGFG
jgi:hypothetical protein